MPPQNKVLDLSWLLAPVGVTTFRQNHWEKSPLLIKREDRLYYHDLFSLDAADELISASSRQSPNIRIVKNGRESSLDSVIPTDQAGLYVEHVYSAYRDGSTIVLPYVHERWPALQTLCAALSGECSIGFQVNAYLTPRGEQGLGVHYDTHDVFVLQVEGSKHWRICESSLRLPLPSQPYLKEAAAPATPTQAFDLNAGDLLYVPRGFIHEAIAKEDLSLHLTVGMLTLTWAEVILVAVESAVELQAACRVSLPLGFAKEGPHDTQLEGCLRELVDGIVKKIPYETVIEDAITRARLAIRPVLRGHLRDINAETQVTIDTPVMKRDGLQCWLSTNDDEVCLSFHGKEIWMPEYVEHDLRFIAATKGPFAGATLPGPLDEAGRLTLVRRLLREGFVTLAAKVPLVPG